MPDFSLATSKELLGHSKKVHSVAWNSSGKKLASGSVDRTVRVWSIEHHLVDSVAKMPR